MVIKICDWDIFMDLNYSFNEGVVFGSSYLTSGPDYEFDKASYPTYK